MLYLKLFLSSSFLNNILNLALGNQVLVEMIAVSEANLGCTYR